MNFTGHKFFATLILLIVSMMCFQPTLGLCVNRQVANLNQPNNPVSGEMQLNSIVIAQNDTGENEKSDGSKTDTETKKSASADDEKDKASKSKPLKPFIPSEKIPGEQAVDFPVDI